MTNEQRRRYAIAVKAINEIARREGVGIECAWCAHLYEHPGTCVVAIARNAQREMRKKGT